MNDFLLSVSALRAIAHYIIIRLNSWPYARNAFHMNSGSAQKFDGISENVKSDNMGVTLKIQH